VPSPGNPQSLNRYAYTLNNPLRYTDPTGHFEEDQLKEWFPDLWKSWKNDYPNFWSMLLVAEFGDLVNAHFGEHIGYFMRTQDSGRPIIGTSELPEWPGSPHYTNLYSYILTKFDDVGNFKESIKFGDYSVDWLYEGNICTVRRRYTTYEFSNPLTNGQWNKATQDLFSDATMILIEGGVAASKFALKKIGTELAVNFIPVINGIVWGYRIVAGAIFLDTLFEAPVLHEMTTSHYDPYRELPNK